MYIVLDSVYILLLVKVTEDWLKELVYFLLVREALLV